MITKSSMRAHQKTSVEKMLKQRILAIFLLLICVVNIIIAIYGETPEQKDITAVVLLAPLGFYMLFTKQYIEIV